MSANNIETQNANPKTVRVFSQRLNDYVEVPLTPDNPREELLAGVMPVMLVTDHPLIEESRSEGD